MLLAIILCKLLCFDVYLKLLKKCHQRTHTQYSFGRLLSLWWFFCCVNFSFSFFFCFVFLFLFYQEHLCKIDEMKTTKYNSLIFIFVYYIQICITYTKKVVAARNSVFYSSKSAKGKKNPFTQCPTVHDLKHNIR